MAPHGDMTRKIVELMVRKMPDAWLWLVPRKDKSHMLFNEHKIMLFFTKLVMTFWITLHKHALCTYLLPDLH